MKRHRFYIVLITSLLVVATTFRLGVGQEKSELTLSKKQKQDSSAEIANMRVTIKSLETTVKVLGERVTRLEQQVRSLQSASRQRMMPLKKEVGN